MEYKAPPAPLSVKPVDYMTTGKAIQEGVQGLGTGVQKGLEAVSSAFSQRDFKMYQREVKQKLMSTFAKPDGTTDFQELLPDSNMNPDQVREGLINIQLIQQAYEALKRANPNANTGSLGSLASISFYGGKDATAKLLDPMIKQLPEEDKKNMEIARQKAFGTAIGNMNDDRSVVDNLKTLGTTEGIPSETQEKAALAIPTAQTSWEKMRLKALSDEARMEMAEKGLKVRQGFLRAKLDENKTLELVRVIQTFASVVADAGDEQASIAKMQSKVEDLRKEAEDARGTRGKYLMYTKAEGQAAAEMLDQAIAIAQKQAIDAIPKSRLLNNLVSDVAPTVESIIPDKKPDPAIVPSPSTPPPNPFEKYKTKK